MNLHHQIASTLTVAALFAVLVLVVMKPQNARPAVPPPSPAMLTAYVRGWIDGAAPPGVYAVTATCTARHVCTVILSDGYCARATVTGYAFAGPWHRCPRRPTS